MSEDQKYPSQLAERFQIRMPEGLRDEIRIAADANGRSMNAEIIHRLRQSNSDEPDGKKHINLPDYLYDRLYIEAIEHDISPDERAEQILSSTYDPDDGFTLANEIPKSMKNYLSKLRYMKDNYNEQIKKHIERETYWVNISMALNSIRRTQLSLFKFAMQNVTLFKDKIPVELYSYSENLLKIYEKELDDLPDNEKSINFLKTQAENAHNLVYAVPDGEEDPDFIVDPPKQN